MRSPPSLRPGGHQPGARVEAGQPHHACWLVALVARDESRSTRSKATRGFGWSSSRDASRMGSRERGGRGGRGGRRGGRGGRASSGDDRGLLGGERVTITIKPGGGAHVTVAGAEEVVDEACAQPGVVREVRTRPADRQARTRAVQMVRGSALRWAICQRTQRQQTCSDCTAASVRLWRRFGRERKLALSHSQVSSRWHVR